MPAWNPQANELFLQALEITEPEEHRAFLDRSCGDAKMRRAVEVLLAAHAAAGNFLETPAANADRTNSWNGSRIAERGAPRSFLGQVIADKYRLVECLGEGGMGGVFLAQQTEPLRRVVAVKLVKPGMDSQAVLTRFEAERQALAVMDHPNIAKILDGGLHENRPFFVMELIRGTPITRFCDERKLTPKERLELFVPICDAIQHAHQKGIIHRDIKPSNVLVGLYDDRPVPKIIDFGVAKATGRPLTDVSAHTGFGIVIGTPEYMSPEQANFNHLDVDTRSDVYALGVLLYELLTGSPPFREKNRENVGVLEILRVIREEEAPRPSTKLSAAETLPGIAACRSVEPARLTKLVKGELDWIVMKALEKDRTRRYETANGLAADVRRYLSGEPVLAHPPSVGYRLRKFVHRHQGRAIAASLMLLMLLGGVVGTSLGLVHAEEQRAISDEHRIVAEEATKTEQKRSEELAETLEKLKAEQRKTQEALVEAEKARREEANQREKAVAEREKTERLLAQNRILLAEATFEGSGTAQRANELLDAVPERLRGWEWNYLKRKYHGGIATLLGHAQPVTQVAVSPDGRWVASASEDSTIRLWDADTGETRFVLRGHTQRVNAVTFSPDGSRIASASKDQTVRVWEVRTGKHVSTTLGHKGSVNTVAFSPDGSRITSGGDDKSIRVWEVTGGKPILQIAAGTNTIIEGVFPLSVNAVAYSPDGAWIAEASYDGYVRVWDAHTGKRLREFKADRTDATGVAFSPDGTLVAASYEYGPVRIWDLQTGRVLRELKGHSETVTGVAFSPDGTRLASSSLDQTIRVWEVATGQSVFELKGHTGAVTGVAFSPDGTRLVSGAADRSVRFWNARTGLSHLDIKIDKGLWFKTLDFSPDGERIASGSLYRLDIWEARTGRPAPGVAFGQIGEDVLTVRFLPHGKSIVAGMMYATRGATHIRDASTGGLILKVEGSRHPVHCLALSADGGTIVTAGWGSMIHLWDAKTGDALGEMSGHASNSQTAYYVRGLAFSPDQSQLASAGADKTVRIWDMKTHRTVRILEGHTAEVNCLAYSPDGKRLVTGSADKTIRVWDARTGALVGELKGHSRAVQSICFSPDGSRIASGSADKTIRLWEAATGEFLIELKGHAATVHAVQFSPDGTRLASGSFDRVLRIWDARSGPRFPPEEALRLCAAISRPDPIWHREQLNAAKKANAPFAVAVRNYLFHRAIAEEHLENNRFAEALAGFAQAEPLKPKPTVVDVPELLPEPKAPK